MANPFVERFKNKPTSQLVNMVENPSGFNPVAINAAKEVLERRKSGDEEFQEPIKPVYVEPDIEPSKLFSKLNTSLKSVAIYQILSSLYAFQYLVGFNLSSLFNVIFLLMFLFTYVAGLAGGIMLLKKKRIGFTISILFNAIQTLSITLGGFSFFSMGLFGVYFEISFISGVHFQFLLELGSRMAFLFYDTEPFAIGINLVAVFAMIIIMKAKDTFEETGLFSDELLNSNIQFSE